MKTTTKSHIEYDNEIVKLNTTMKTTTASHIEYDNENDFYDLTPLLLFVEFIVIFTKMTTKTTTRMDTLNTGQNVTQDSRNYFLLNSIFLNSMS